MSDFAAPRDNLVRALSDAPEFRESTEDGRIGTLTGYFSRFDEPTLIDSAIEGRFIERIAPTAFTKTLAERTPKVLFQHGKDPQIGDKPLGAPVVTVDGGGARYEVPLLDTSYNRDLLPGLKAGLYGSSFRFSVVKEKWNQSPARSASNPDGLPERTVLEAKVPEFGPVTFPAYAGATAFARSMTDEFTLDRLTSDPERLRALIDQALPGEEPAPATPPTEPPAPATEPDSRSADPVATEYVTPEEKASRLSELKDVIKRTADEWTGVMPADVQARWDADNAEHDELVRDIAARNARLTRLAQIEAAGVVESTTFTPPTIKRTQAVEDVSDLGKIRAETRTREEFDTRVQENALRMIDMQKTKTTKDLNYLVQVIEELDEGRDDNGETVKGEIARRVLLTGTPAYRRFYNKYLRNQVALATPEETRAAALAVTGTTTTGGYAVPYIFDPTLYHTGVWTAENPFRAACRVETITNGNNWRTVTVGNIAWAYGTEASAATEGGPTFGQPTFTVQTAKGFATLSVETLEDRPDINAELASVFAEGKDTLEENQFAIGVGTTVYPFGMFVDTAYTNQDTATNDVTAIADLQVLEGALPLRYRKNAAFFMNRTSLRAYLALDTTYRYFSGRGLQYPGNNQPNGNGGGNTGYDCLGYPVWEVPSAPTGFTSDGVIHTVFADPRTFVIVDRLGMNTEVIPQMLNGATPSFPTLQRGIVVWCRNTAKPIAADGGRSLSVQ